MFKFILGRKIGMSQIFQKDGIVVPITLIEAEPNVVLGIKTKEKDGYDAVQVGFDPIVKKRGAIKPVAGHFKKKYSSL